MARSTHSRRAHAGARRGRPRSAAGETAAGETAAGGTAAADTQAGQIKAKTGRIRPGRAGGGRGAASVDSDSAGGAPALTGARSRPSTVRVVVAVAAVGLLAAIIGAGGFSPAPSAEPTVQAFLLAWQQGQYQRAAAMTTGAPAAVARSLAVVYRQLDAAQDSLRMGDITQHGDAAFAYFYASINLGRGGLPWTYRGHFPLHRTGTTWKVDWSPSVVVPGLRTGQRLAILTTMPRRAPLLGATGQPLALPSTVYVLGVRPGALRRPRATADDLARATGLDAQQVLGQITAAPLDSFLELARLRPAVYRPISRQLRKVPGLIISKKKMRLFRSIAPMVTGAVGTETASVLRHNGVPYRPGTTVGLSGLQQAFQHTLTGTPTTEVVVESRTGHLVTVLRRWPGHQGTPVRTTINPAVQLAADRAMRGLPGSAAIVAIRAGSGQILAVARRKAAGLPSVQPLDGRYRPGQAFTIISTAALLDTGFRVSTPIPCDRTNKVSGEVFANGPGEPYLGTQPPFSTDFAHACRTAFAGLSLQLNSKDLTRAADGFGIGADWRLPLRHFTGLIPAPAGGAQIAEDTVGAGQVRVSPLDMALAAGVVESGTWHQPSLVTSPPDPGLRPRALFDSQVVDTLRKLMRSTVRSGAGASADIGGPATAAVYGQVGSASVGQGGQHVRASWFVGFRGSVAFAVLVFDKSAAVSRAAPLAGRFARLLGQVR
jgi:cell division protein FtsI/penicillin-binding protein 2